MGLRYRYWGREGAKGSGFGTGRRATRDGPGLGSSPTAGARYLLLRGSFSAGSFSPLSATPSAVPVTDRVTDLPTDPRDLAKLYSWGDLTDEDYRREMAETRTLLAELPDPNKLVAFDRNRHVMVTMAENVDRATRPQVAELVQLLVERALAKGRTVEPESIEWTPPARPFFEPSALLKRPRTDSNRRRRP